MGRRLTSEVVVGRAHPLEVLDGALTAELGGVASLSLLSGESGIGKTRLVLEAFLARNVRSERIAVLATYRSDDEVPDHLRRVAAELVRRRGVTRIELGPLTAADVATQLEAMAGGPVVAGLAADLHRRAGGNPFFVEELFAAQVAGEIPATLADAVLLRVDRLGASAGHALTVVAVAAAGGRLDDVLLQRLGLEPEALRAGMAVGLLVREPDGVALRHGLIGEVVYGRLLPVERMALHRAIAAGLPAGEAGRRADQCHRAGLRAEALVASVQAGLDAAAMHAHDEALIHLERGLALWDEAVPLDGTFGPFMRVNAAEDLVRLGRWDEAARRVADAERLELSRTTAAMRRATAGLLQTLRGDVAAARRELEARTSCRSTPPAKRMASPSSSCASSTATTCAPACGATDRWRRCRRRRSRTASGRRWTRSTARAWCTATSSPRTSSWRPATTST